MNQWTQTRRGVHSAFTVGVVLILMLLAGSYGALTVQAQAENGMVASAHPLASEAGLEMLKLGGNAVDAAVATAFAIGVVEPHASGLGGGGFMTVYLAEEDKAIVIDYQTEAPRAHTPDLVTHDNPTTAERDARRRVGARASLVPGNVAGLTTALEKYGTLSLAEVLAPSIRLAREGFPVSRTVHEAIMDNYETLIEDEGSAAVWLEDGLPYFEGDTIQLPDLANTLEKIANEGPDVFYHGEIADAIVQTMEENGGYITHSDLAAFEPVVTDALHSQYKDLDIFGVPPVGTGNLVLAQALNVLEHYDLAAMGHNEPQTILRLGDALRVGFYDRLRWAADPRFVDTPTHQLVAKEYAAVAQQLMDDTGRGNFDRNDLPNPDHFEAVAPYGEDDGGGSGSTTHLSTMDKDGNMVSVTQTIVYFFGSKTTVPGTGIVMNNALTSFAANPGNLNSIEGGKRPRSYMAPTVILRDGKPYMAVGSPGSDRIPTAILQVLLNIVEFDMDLQEAIDAPRFHTTTGATLHVEDRFEQDTLDALTEMGYNINNTRGEFDLYFGGVQLIVFDPETGTFEGSADPRRDGAVAGF